MNKLFFVYVKRVFLPLLICWLPVILIFGLGGIVNLLIAVHTGDGWPLVFWSFMMVTSPIPFLVFAHFVSKRTLNKWVRAASIYLVYFIIFFAAIYAIGMVIGGTSMGAVENPGLASSRAMDQLVKSLELMLKLQPLILGFTAYGVWRENSDFKDALRR